MAIYHFTWDLEFFGYVPPAMTAVGGWKLFARCIASSFLFLVGVSLFLGHAKGIRWPGFLRRLAMVAGAALAISLVTYIAVPDGFIFFGILHQIALASVLGLAFLRLPAVVTLACRSRGDRRATLSALGFLQRPLVVVDRAFREPAALQRLRAGLPVVRAPCSPASRRRRSRSRTGLLAQARGHCARRAGHGRLTFGGRHSLAVYLIHQPVLIACIWLFSQVFPPAEETREVRFLQSCEAACKEQRDTEFCARYCVCMLDTLERENAIEGVYAGDRSEELQSRVEDIAGRCTIATDNAMLEGGSQ